MSEATVLLALRDGGRLELTRGIPYPLTLGSLGDQLRLRGDSTDLAVTTLEASGHEVPFVIDATASRGGGEVTVHGAIGYDELGTLEVEGFLKGEGSWFRIM
jgi:hypothetical protein